MWGHSHKYIPCACTKTSALKWLNNMHASNLIYCMFVYYLFVCFSESEVTTHYSTCRAQFCFGHWGGCLGRSLECVSRFKLKLVRIPQVSGCVAEGTGVGTGSTVPSWHRNQKCCEEVADTSSSTSQKHPFSVQEAADKVRGQREHSHTLPIYRLYVDWWSVVSRGLVGVWPICGNRAIWSVK